MLPANGTRPNFIRCRWRNWIQSLAYVASNSLRLTSQAHNAVTTIDVLSTIHTQSRFSRIFLASRWHVSKYMDVVNIQRVHIRCGKSHLLFIYSNVYLTCYYIRKYDENRVLRFPRAFTTRTAQVDSIDRVVVGGGKKIVFLFLLYALRIVLVVVGVWANVVCSVLVMNFPYVFVS